MSEKGNDYYPSEGSNLKTKSSLVYCRCIKSYSSSPFVGEVIIVLYLWAVFISFFLPKLFKNFFFFLNTTIVYNDFFNKMLCSMFISVTFIIQIISSF